MNKPIKTICSMTYYFPYSHIIVDFKNGNASQHPYFSGWSIEQDQEPVRKEENSVAIAEIYY